MFVSDSVTSYLVIFSEICLIRQDSIKMSIDDQGFCDPEVKIAAWPYEAVCTN